MADGRAIPLPKRFPGQCVIRFKLWTKKRTIIELEGPTDERVATAALVLMAGKLPEETIAALEKLCDDLRPAAARLAEGKGEGHEEETQAGRKGKDKP